jgi:hypothetical protein
MRVDKTDNIGDVKKKMQKFLMKLWSRMFKGEDRLFVVDVFDMRAKYETEIVDLDDNSVIPTPVKPLSS